MTISTLTTSRLILRPLELADAPAIQEQFAHWEIVRLLVSSVPWPYPADGATIFVRDHALPAVSSGVAWHWSLRLKPDGEPLIGIISLMDIPNDNRGFWVGLPWQGQGFVTEACEAVTEFWFEKLERPVLRVPKAMANTASQRISMRSGMRVIATLERDYVSGRLPAQIWEITRDEWRARRAKVC